MLRYLYTYCLKNYYRNAQHTNIRVYWLIIPLKILSRCYLCYVVNTFSWYVKSRSQCFYHYLWTLQTFSVKLFLLCFLTCEFTVRGTSTSYFNKSQFMTLIIMCVICSPIVKPYKHLLLVTTQTCGRFSDLIKEDYVKLNLDFLILTFYKRKS